MSRIANLAEAERQLAIFYANTRRTYTLTTMYWLMDFLGNPQETFRTIHVAGTSGKTSTAYYVAALLRKAGYHTGLTISPHVDSLTERVQIDSQPIDEATFCTALAEFLALVKSSHLKPSWFEVMVAFAYWFFARQQIEYAIVEVGLGGLKDGTNVIQRPDKVCIITDIGLDHTQILGNTLAEIAAQKAGIIQPHNAVFTYRQSDEVMQVFEAAVRRQEADLHIVGANHEAELCNLPLFQRHNFHLARKTVDYVLRKSGKPKLTDSQINKSVETYIPGRMEAVQIQDKVIVLDGAHNAQKLTALSNSLHAKYSHQKIAVMVAFGEGDQGRLDGAVEVLSGLTDHLIITTFVTAKDVVKQAVDPKVVVAACQKHGMTAEILAEPSQAFAALLARPEPVLLVTGSFYLLNHIRPLMLSA